MIVNIESFGYGHAPAPEADITLDTRRRFRNPHADPAMREKTGLDPAVRQHVMDTPGVRDLVCTSADLALALADAGPLDRPVTVAVGCVGGRHRSVAIADAIADRLTRSGIEVTLNHRDVDKPVIQPTPTHELPRAECAQAGVYNAAW